MGDSSNDKDDGCDIASGNLCACGNHIAIDARFCSQCGTPVSEPTTQKPHPKDLRLDVASDAMGGEAATESQAEREQKTSSKRLHRGRGVRARTPHEHDENAAVTAPVSAPSVAKTTTYQQIFQRDGGYYCPLCDGLLPRLSTNCPRCHVHFMRAVTPARNGTNGMEAVQPDTTPPPLNKPLPPNVRCANCSAIIGAENAYCTECGTALAHQGAPLSTTVRTESAPCASIKLSAPTASPIPSASLAKPSVTTGPKVSQGVASPTTPSIVTTPSSVVCPHCKAAESVRPVAATGPQLDDPFKGPSRQPVYRSPAESVVDMLYYCVVKPLMVALVINPAMKKAYSAHQRKLAAQNLREYRCLRCQKQWAA